MQDTTVVGGVQTVTPFDPTHETFVKQRTTIRPVGPYFINNKVYTTRAACIYVRQPWNQTGRICVINEWIKRTMINEIMNEETRINHTIFGWMIYNRINISL